MGDEFIVEPAGDVYERWQRGLALVAAGNAAAAAEVLGQAALYGAGLAASQTGDPRWAAELLALACAMRPDKGDHAPALTQVRATLAASRSAGKR